jgi:ribose transport system substrate-binding protein
MSSQHIISLGGGFNMQRLMAVFAAGAIGVGVVACGSDDSASTKSTSSNAASAPKTKTIGVANFTLGAAYFIGMSKAVQVSASEVGDVKVKVTDAGGDGAKLTSDIQNLISQKVDGIIISAGPLAAAPAALKAAKDAGIPVVMVDRKLTGDDYTSWIGPDNEAIGKQDGEFIAKQLTDGGKVAIIRGGPADNTIGLDRTNGMLSVVKANPKIQTITAPDFGDWGTDGGVKVAENLLAKNKDLSFIFCENDSMCLGAQKAVKDAGLSDKISLGAVDGQKEALKAILDGSNYAVTGKNDADEIGRLGFQRMMDIFAGKQIEKDSVVPSPEITKDNAKQFYDPNSLF